MKTLSILILLFPSLLFAGSKKIKVDLDVKSTVFVVANVDVHSIYYYIDKVACICTQNTMHSGFSGLASVPCKKLAAHAKLKEHVAHCKD